MALSLLSITIETGFTEIIIWPPIATQVMDVNGTIYTLVKSIRIEAIEDTPIPQFLYVFR